MLKKYGNYKKVKMLMKRLEIFNIKKIDWNVQSKDGCSLFEEAVYAGFTEEELTLILKYALEHGMNINKRTSMYGDTYMHALIECDDYHGNLAPFLYLGYINGFNPDIKNFENKTVWDALKKPDTTKKIDESDRRLCFQIKKIYEIENKKDELLNLQKRITLLQEKEKSLKNFIDDNKGTNEEIIKALEKTL